MSRSRFIYLPLSLSLSLTAGAGCADHAEDPTGGSASVGNDPMDDEDEEEEEEEEEEQAGSCSITYQNAIYDGGEVTVYYIYLFPSGADDPGPDLLGSSGVLLYGYQLEVTDIPAGTYDSIVVDEDDYFYLSTGIDCDDNAWTWRITASDAAGQLD